MDNKRTALQIMEDTRKRGIILYGQDGRLRYRANAGVLTEKDKEQIREFKSEILQILDQEPEKIEIQDRMDERYEPFPLTDVQQAYLMGRNNLFEYGDVACHIYLQLIYDKLDPVRVEKVWNLLIKQHEMLRSVVYEDGCQKILEKAPEFRIHNFGDEASEYTMDKMGHSKYTVGQWPFFSVGISEEAGKSIMHFSIEFIIADWTSIWSILSQFEQLYFEKAKELPEVGLSFRDYVFAEKAMKTGRKYETDKMYWLDRVGDFPEAPKLPVKRYDRGEPALFERKHLQISPERWNKIKENATRHSVTPTAMVLMAYASVLERYSLNKRFALNLTILNRLPVHRDVQKVIGDFTSINLLEMDFMEAESFIKTAQKVNARLFDDLDHRLFSGIEVMRELSRTKGREAAFMPYVFTSAIGLLSSVASAPLMGMISGKGISQTPQVFIDCQAMDGEFGLQVNWDIRKGVFDETMTDDMFQCFQSILDQMAEGSRLDKETLFILPQYQMDLFSKVNNTREELPGHLLHEQIIKMADIFPDKTAVVSDGMKVTYRQLMDLAYGVYKKILQAGCSKNDRVVIMMEKSVYQAASAIAVLAAGAVYVPVAADQGHKRVQKIIDKTDSKIAVVLSHMDTDDLNGIEVVAADETSEQETGVLPCSGKESDLAYIIFTSGSTGEPKGAAITHQAAVNTIEDINKRFKVRHNDTILGISEFNFDLSVFDVFGILSAGGTVVYPEHGRTKEPAYLINLMNQYHVTIWNSVPALMQILMTYAETGDDVDISSLRLVLLSGDWIPAGLPEQIQRKAEQAEVISLGGATEASIWSIIHECNGPVPGFESIPYGVPLANQGFRVLDVKLQDCPVGVKGELYITGKGLAEGYYHDEDRTRQQFIIHPTEGVRMYKTGDWGKYHRNGEIEFLGRDDHQIKLNGHRIELGEIEAAVEKYPGISNSVVLFCDTQGEKKLSCFYESAPVSGEEQIKEKQKSDKLMRNLDASAVEIFESLNEEALERAVRLRDRAVMTSMAYALQTAAGKREFTIDDLKNSEGISDDYIWLVEYWIKLLEDSGCLIQNPGNIYRISGSLITSQTVNSLWNKVREAWIYDLGSKIFFDYICQNSQNLNGLLSKKTDPIKLLYPEGKDTIVTEMYVDNKMSQYLNQCICEFISRYTKDHESVKILEIGAGTCATAIQIVETLGDSDYSYHVTDISSYFLPAAQKKFEGNDNVKFSVLNIEGDIYDQGFGQNQYDLVIAAGVLENAADIGKSLENVKALTAPGGYFLFTEPVRDEPWILASQGFLMTKPGDSLRRDHAFITRHEWETLLNEIDQSGICRTYPENTDSPLTSLGLCLYVKQMKSDKQQISIPNLKTFMSDYLPDYMIPYHFQMIDQFPVTSNGKVDRKALTALTIQDNQRQTEHNYKNEPMSTLQKKISDIWENAGIKNLGLDDDLYESGADSLIMAQVTGKLREDIAGDIPFDTLLRQLLTKPTLRQISEFLDRKGEEQMRPEKNENLGAAEFYDAGEGPLRVYFPAGFGVVNSIKFVVPGLTEQKKGKVMVIVLRDTEKFCSMPKEEVLARLTDDYSKLILQTGCSQVQLIGYCFGGLLAASVGSRLQEMGIEITDLSIIDSQSMPWRIEDDLLYELMFATNFYLGFQQLGLNNGEFVEPVFQQNLKKYGCIPENALTQTEYGERFADEKAAIMNLNKKSRRARFELYAAIAKDNLGENVDVEMLEDTFDVFVQTIKSMQCEAQPYIGDIRYFCAKEYSDMFFDCEKNLSYWRDLCIGELSVHEINGNHYSCVGEKQHAAKLVQMLGESN